MHTCWTREGHAGSWWGDLKQGDHVRDLGVDGRIILKLMFKKWNSIKLAKYRNSWRELLNGLMNFRPA
jgi:hypothetical protein